MRKTIKNFMYIKRKETAIMMIAVAIAIIAGMVLGFFVSMGDDETVQLGMMMALSAYVIFDIIFEGFTFGQHFTLCLQMGVTISLAVLLAFLAVFVGAAVLRFGRIAFWVLWTFWMIVLLKSPDNISVPALFHADIWVFVPVWLAISAAIGIMLYLITYHCFIKDQSVKA